MVKYKEHEQAIRDLVLFLFSCFKFYFIFPKSLITYSPPGNKNLFEIILFKNNKGLYFSRFFLG